MKPFLDIFRAYLIDSVKLPSIWQRVLHIALWMPSWLLMVCALLVVFVFAPFYYIATGKNLIDDK